MSYLEDNLIIPSNEATITNANCPPPDTVAIQGEVYHEYQSPGVFRLWKHTLRWESCCGKYSNSF